MNVSVGVRYLDAWLQGVGAAAIDNLMEDAATAEISRAQVWSWVQVGRFDESPRPRRDRQGRRLGRGQGRSSPTSRSRPRSKTSSPQPRTSVCRRASARHHA